MTAPEQERMIDLEELVGYVLAALLFLLVFSPYLAPIVWWVWTILHAAP